MSSFQQPIPNKIRVASEPTLYRIRVPMKAVGEEFDSEFKPLYDVEGYNPATKPEPESKG